MYLLMVAQNQKNGTGQRHQNAFAQVSSMKTGQASRFEKAVLLALSRLAATTTPSNSKKHRAAINNGQSLFYGNQNDYDCCMRILIIRHADPDYKIDGLTKEGQKEANALAQYLKNIPIDAIYVSPLGRAQRTMEPYLKESGTSMKPIVLDWLREFLALVPHDSTRISWDILPSTLEEGGDTCFDPSRWMESLPFYRENKDLKEQYEEVCQGLEKVLNLHGYHKVGHHYETEKGNQQTIAFFCHFGVESVMLSYLLNASPVTFWQGTCAVPSSITSLYTEERREGIASFRMNQFGGTPHLDLAGLEPSFSARFSETFDDPRRHD